MDEGNTFEYVIGSNDKIINLTTHSPGNNRSKSKNLKNSGVIRENFGLAEYLSPKRPLFTIQENIFSHSSGMFDY